MGLSLPITCSGFAPPIFLHKSIREITFHLPQECHSRYFVEFASPAFVCGSRIYWFFEYLSTISTKRTKRHWRITRARGVIWEPGLRNRAQVLEVGNAPKLSLRLEESK